MKLNLEDRKMIIGEILHLKEMFDPEGEDAAAMEECVMRLARRGGLIRGTTEYAENTEGKGEG